MNVEGVTWHAIVLAPEPFASTKALMTETFGLAPAMEAEGVVLFIMPNGTMLELHAPQALPDYGFNEGGVVFGFRVDDVEAARPRSRRRAASYSPDHPRGGDGGVRLPTLPRSGRPRLRPKRAEVARARSGGQVHRQSIAVADGIGTLPCALFALLA